MKSLIGSHKTRVAALFLVTIAFTMASNAAADDAYTLGSLDGQNGWNGGIGGFQNNDAGDEAVTNADARSGTQSWRYSRGYNSPGQGTPFSPQLVTVGRPTSGAAGDISIVKFAFKAVVAADLSVQTVYLGADARNDRTGNHIVLRNNADGVHLTMSTFTPGPGCNGFATQDFATVSGTAWHTVKMTTQYHEDLTQDITTYVIDEGTGGEVTFNALGWMHTWRDCNGFVYTPGASLKFTSTHADGDLSFNGFYYDEVSLEVRNSASNTQVGFFDANFEQVAVPVELSEFTID